VSCRKRALKPPTYHGSSRLPVIITKHRLQTLSGSRAPLFAQSTIVRHEASSNLQGSSTSANHGCCSSSLAVILFSGSQQSILPTTKSKEACFSSPSSELIVFSNMRSLGIRSGYRNCPADESVYLVTR
jgi:hypothetical protein